MGVSVLQKELFSSNTLIRLVCTGTDIPPLMHRSYRESKEKKNHKEGQREREERFIWA